MDLKRKANELRKDVLELVYRAGAGHIGGDLSVMDILTVLYFHEANISPENQTSPDRDRILLSKGHCADALYTVLADKGFFSKEELKATFSRYSSKYMGHPDNAVAGVEMCAGSLGHGLSVGAGMALAGKRDNRKYRVYVVLGDGEMAEGSNFEAMMFAAHYSLDNLCAVVDVNGLQISGRTDEVMKSAELSEKFFSFGWNVITVKNGNDTEELIHAFSEARAYQGKPSVLLAHTVKGKGVSFMENNVKWHHGVLNEKQFKKAIAEREDV